MVIKRNLGFITCKERKMTTLVMNYTVNPILRILKSIYKTFSEMTEVAGYSRAAAELARLGYYEESKQCMMMIKTIKNR